MYSIVNPPFHKAVVVRNDCVSYKEMVKTYANVCFKTVLWNGLFDARYTSYLSSTLKANIDNDFSHILKYNLHITQHSFCNISCSKNYVCVTWRNGNKTSLYIWIFKFFHFHTEIVFAVSLAVPRYFYCFYYVILYVYRSKIPSYTIIPKMVRKN